MSTRCYEYERNGTATIVMMFAPVEDGRHVKVTDRRVALIVRRFSKNCATRTFPWSRRSFSCKTISAPTSRRQSTKLFPPARRLVERFEWHDTHRHGSWLDMAESELGVLPSQCLDRRIPDKQSLIDEVAAWEVRHHRHHTKADWQFAATDARVKPKRLCPA